MALSLQVNYIMTERSMLVCDVSPNSCDGVAWSAQLVPMADNLGSLHRSHNFSFKWLHSYPHEAQ
jgi:hypothetical protein